MVLQTVSVLENKRKPASVDCDCGQAIKSSEGNTTEAIERRAGVETFLGLGETSTISIGQRNIDLSVNAYIEADSIACEVTDPKVLSLDKTNGNQLSRLSNYSYQYSPLDYYNIFFLTIINMTSFGI